MNTKSDADEIWKFDLLNRRTDADFLISFLETRINERSDAGLCRNYVLNIDAEWGQGKTFFLNSLKAQLEFSNRTCVYVNAWENDHAEDPMIAFMAEINKTIEPYIKKGEFVANAWRGLKHNTGRIFLEFGKGAVKQLTRKVIGEGAEEISNLLYDNAPQENLDASAEKAGIATAQKEVERLLDKYADNLIDNFNKKNQSIELFRKELSNLIEHINKIQNTNYPLYILIDELDRCRPNYAIALLERVKHIFSAENVVFIIATDTKQLRHAVSAVYGESFDGTRYLQRFFDRTFTFEDPNLEDFVKKLFHKYNIDQTKLSAPIDNPETYFTNVMVNCGINLRDIEKCFDLMRGVMTMWSKNIEIELLILLPLIILYNSRDIDGYEALKRQDTSFINTSIFNNNLSYTFMFRRGGSGEQRVVMNAALLEGMVTQMKKPLADSVDHSNTWISTRFRREFETLHRSIHDPGNPARSIMNDYARFVEGSGRFSSRNADTS